MSQNLAADFPDYYPEYEAVQICVLSVKLKEDNVMAKKTAKKKTSSSKEKVMFNYEITAVFLMFPRTEC